MHRAPWTRALHPELHLFLTCDASRGSRSVAVDIGTDPGNLGQRPYYLLHVGHVVEHGN